MIINRNKIAATFICIYPILNILICILSEGDNMNAFSVSYCLLMLIVLVKWKRVIKREFFLLCLGLAIVLSISFIRESQFSNVVISLLFAFTVVFFSIFALKMVNIDNFLKYFEKKRKIFYFAQVLFIVILLWYVKIYGFSAGWNTLVLQGPYNYPHTLAYMLLFLSCGNIGFVLTKGEVIPILLTVAEWILVILTAVRSALVSIAILALYMLWFYYFSKQIKKLLILTIVGVLSLIIAWQIGVFDAFIIKTMLAVEGGFGVTNNRFATFLSSINTLVEYGSFPINWLFGTGLELMLKINDKELGTAIHAHNDFIDALVSYGIIGFVSYTFYFIKMCTGNSRNIWLLTFIGVLAFYNGLFTYIDAIPLLLLPVMVFCSNRHYKIDTRKKRIP